MRNPKVTVLMSVYNGEKYLNEAIDSILRQTFKDFEFLIINDGSTDRTADILKSYNDKRIKILNNKKNIGISKSRNKGLKIAKGKYIAVMDADDISLPLRLEKEIGFLDQNKNIGLVGTSYLIINENGKVLHVRKCISEYEELKLKLLEWNQFAHGSIMFRKECIKKVGLYREEFKLALDYDLVLRISEEFEVSNIPEFLYKWRLNIKSVSVTKKELQDKYALLAIELAKERKKFGKDKLQTLKKEEINKLLDELISDIKIQNRKKIAQGYLFWSEVLLTGKDYKGALIFFLKSFVINPFNKSIYFQILKNLVFLLFPAQIVNMLKVIKKRIFYNQKNNPNTK